MSKPYLFLIPFTLPWNWSADYQRQTINELRKNHHVLAYMQLDARFWFKQYDPDYLPQRNLTFFVPRYLLPFRRFKAIEMSNQILSMLFVLFKYRHYQLVFWIFDPDFYYLPKFFRKTISLYDCVDYHFDPNPARNQEIRQTEKQLIRDSSFFIVNSHILAHIHQKIRKPDLIVPQGFSKVEMNSNHKFELPLHTKKPLLGYIGGINNRIDYGLLHRMMKNNPSWFLLLYGPIQAENEAETAIIKKNLKKLTQLKNIFYGGSIERQKVSSILKQINIGLIPYDIENPFNKYCYPMKVMEYFYFGIPVVSTPIVELKQFPKFVKVGATADDWTKEITRLMAKEWPESFKRQQKAISLKNTWQKKVEKITKLVT